MNLSVLDMVILVVLGIFAVKGLLRGIILEVFTLVGLLLGYIIALRQMSTVSNFLMRYLSLPSLFLNSICFIGIFLLIVLLFRWLASLLRDFARWTLIGWLDRGGGFVFGVLKGSLILSLFFLLFSFLPLPDKVRETQDESLFFQPVSQVAPAVFSLIKKVFPRSKDFYQEVREGVKEGSSRAVDELMRKRLEKLDPEKLKKAIESLEGEKNGSDQGK